MQQNLSISQDTQMQDVFQDIMHQQLIQPNKMRTIVEEAVRRSMMARGADHEELIEEEPAWILRRQNKNQPHQQHSQKTIYEKQGVLLKQSPNFFGGWQQRYCILRGQRFIYKESKQADSETAGILNFNLLSCDVNILKKGNLYVNFTITIKNCDKHFVFKATNTYENAQWAELLKESIHNSQGFTKNYNYLSTYPRFWRITRVRANSGQRHKLAILCSSEATRVHPLCNAPSPWTSSVPAVLSRSYRRHPHQWQRIATYIRGQRGLRRGSVPLEKVRGQKMVSTVSAVIRTAFRIVHRHLKIVRCQQFQQTVDNFVNKNLGKKYDFSLKDYLFNRSSTTEEDKDFFFCSSLVAKLFKRLELLDQQKSSSQYLPSSFSNKEKLHLRQDGRFGEAFLEQQKIVVFQNLK